MAKGVKLVIDDANSLLELINVLRIKGDIMRGYSGNKIQTATNNIKYPVTIVLGSDLVGSFISQPMAKKLVGKKLEEVIAKELLKL